MNEEEEQGQDSQVGEALKQAGKNAVRNGARQLLNRLGNIVISALGIILPIIAKTLLVVFFITIIGVGLDWLVDAFTVEVSAQAVQTTLVENTTIENGKWKIDPKVYKDILKQLKEEGLTLVGFDERENTLNADNVEEIEYKDLKKLVDAEFASIHPKLSEDDELGTITFTRRAYNAENDDVGTLMTYMDYTKFHEKIDANDYDAVKDRFTLKEQTSTIQQGNEEKIEKKYIAEFAKYTSVNGNITVTAESYDYEILVANFVTPLEFMIANLQITNSKDYILAIADMVANNSKIEFCIQEQYTKVEEQEIEEWDEISGENIDHEIEYGAKNVTETLTFIPYIKNIDTWMAEAKQTYNVNNTVTTDRTGEEAIYDDKINHIKYTNVTTTSYTYSKGVTVTDESEPDDNIQNEENNNKSTIMKNNEEKFLGLWKNSTGKYEQYYNEDGTINENALYNPDGKLVKYGSQGSTVGNIFGASDWFFDLLGLSERTQNHEQLMRYLMYIYSGRDYGVTEFDFSIFEIKKFSMGNRISYDSLNITDSDLEILYKITSAERGNGTQQQQEYVVSVILNRVLSSSFPNTIYGVVFAPYQFEPTSNGSYDAAIPSETTKAAVKNVIENGDTSQCALYFMTPAAAAEQSWLSASNVKFLFNDDNNAPASHNFYTDTNKLDDLKQYMKYGVSGEFTGGINLYNSDGSVNSDSMAQLQSYIEKELISTEYHSNNSFKQNGPFAKWWDNPINSLSKFQCTWWANGRASQYLELSGSKYSEYPTEFGNGGDYYQKNIEGGWFKYGKVPKPNSIISWTRVGQAGHVAYVEAVDSNGIWISEAGGGTSWYGVRRIPLTGYYSSIYSLNGYIYLDEPN